MTLLTKYNPSPVSYPKAPHREQSDQPRRPQPQYIEVDTPPQRKVVQPGGSSRRQWEPQHSQETPSVKRHEAYDTHDDDLEELILQNEIKLLKMKAKRLQG